MVFADLPAVDDRFEGGAMCGEVESTKSVSEIYSPLAGVVVAVNTAVQDDPSLLNSDPYGDGWMIELRVDDPSMIDQLLDADGYRSLTGSDSRVVRVLQPVRPSKPARQQLLFKLR